jgi:hypothetical protein
MEGKGAMVGFRTHTQIRRARTRVVVRFFTLMAMLTAAFAVAVAGHYLLALW